MIYKYFSRVCLLYLLLFFIFIHFRPSDCTASFILLKPMSIFDKEEEKPAAPPDKGKQHDFKLLAPSEDEKSILTVIVNAENKGEFFLKLTKEKNILILPEDLKKMGFTEIPANAVSDKEGYVSLNSLHPDVRFELDEKKLAVDIKAEPKLFEKQRISCIILKPVEIIYTEDSTAFVNYSIRYNAGDSQSFSVPLETYVRLGDYLFQSDFSYMGDENTHTFTRMMSSILWDDTENMRRYTLGDFMFTSGYLGSFGTLGGVSISKNFSLSPYFMKYPNPEISGILQTPSDVEIYANDIMIKKEHLPPGEFEFFNFPVTTGAGNVTLTIRDAYGREERIVSPYYMSSGILAPGLQEYAYHIGYRRENLGRESFAYGDPVFAGFHRIGISETFTAGLRAEADKDTVNIGPLAAFILGNAGETDLTFAMSYEDDKLGYAGALDYFYNSRRFSARASLKHFSEDYANLSFSASDENKIKFQELVSMGINGGAWGSLTGSFSLTDNYDGTDSKIVSLAYSRAVFDNIWMHLTASRTEEDEDSDYRFFAGFNFNLREKNISGNLNYQYEEDGSDISAGLCKNPPAGTGMGYRVSVRTQEEKTDSWETNGEASLQYNGPYGIYRTEYYRTSDENICNLNMAGSMAFINKSIYFSPPVTDSFALVKVGDVKGVGVKYSNEKIGETDRNGEVLVPRLISYYGNHVSIEASDVPLGYNIGKPVKYVSTPYRGGAVVNFDVAKLQAVEGRIFFKENGKKVPSEYAGLEVTVNEKKVESIIGKDGEFYLENIPVGKFPAKVFLNEKTCHFDMTVPENDQIIFNLGEIICETE